MQATQSPQTLAPRRRRWAAVLRLALLATAAACVPPAPAAEAQGLPQRLSDEAFWKMVTELSEPNGFFRSDNFVSNEVTFQHVIPELKALSQSGGVYLGVGPDQNFTYIAAMRPRMAFIVDIRRQNLVQHLMYKAVFEMSENRADFVGTLFSRKRPAGIANDAVPDSIFAAYARVDADSLLFRKNLAAILDRLVRQHKFALSPEDSISMEYVFGAFFAAGPDLTYTFGGPTWAGGAGSITTAVVRRTPNMPTYGELMVERDAAGRQRSYLATEELYRVMRDLEQRNMLVPLVGDFAGGKALKAVGRYVREHGATISAFYTSNVEQYLFRQGDDWRRFFENVSALPVDERSTFIRAVFNGVGYRVQVYPQGPGAQPIPVPLPGPRSETMLCPIGESVKAFDEGRIQSYYDVIQMSRVPLPGQ